MTWSHCPLQPRWVSRGQALTPQSPGLHLPDRRPAPSTSVAGRPAGLARGPRVRAACVSGWAEPENSAAAAASVRGGGRADSRLAGHQGNAMSPAPPWQEPELNVVPVPGPGPGQQCQAGGGTAGGRTGGGQDRRGPTAAAPGPLGIRLPLELGLAGALGRGAGSHLISGSPPAQAATTHLWLRVPSLHQLCPRGGSGRHVSDRVWAQPGGCLHSAPRCALGCPEDGYPRCRQAQGPGHTSCLRYPVAMGPGGTLHLHPQSEDETPGSGLTGAPVS